MLGLLPLTVLIELILITTFNHGFFTIPGFFINTTAYLSFLIIVYFALVKKETLILPSQQSYIWPIILFFVYTLYLFFPIGIYMSGKAATLLLIFVPLFFYPLIISYLLPRFDETKSGKRRFVMLLFFWL